ncbi:MAG: aldehyde oxidase [Planctomycetota bacterium]|nr:MAG: aldehyde oxidase [Planctomycetota bacterium]
MASTAAPPGAVGKSPPRPDGPAKVTGATRYVDDLALPGMWHGATVRCPYPAARLLRLDPAPALAADPEVVVLTARDLPGPNVIQLIADDWPVLAAERVNHACEPVALVAAPTRARALAAAARVVVEAEELPAVLTLDEALRGDPRAGGQQPLVLAACTVERGDVEAGLAGADLIIEGSYETGHQEHIYIETHGAIGIWHGEEAGLEVIGSLQCPYYVHKALVRLFGLPPERVRVRQAPTGGGFGGKEDFPNVICAHAALLSRRCGRPVKIVYDRHEDIIATTKRHPSRVRHRTGVRRDGTLVAQDIEVLLDGGAYVTLSPVVLSRAVLHAGGPYRCPNVRIRGRVLATNTPPNGAFRGFGAPQTQFAAERHMDRIARALGLDPLAIRERNAYRPGDVTPTGQRLDASTNALECLRAAAERTRFRERWRAIERERARGRPDDGQPWQGIGLALVWHGSGFTGDGERRLGARAGVRLLPGGRLEVLAASTDFGQGTSAVFCQLVADAAGVPLEQVQVHEPDTAAVPDSGPTVASRTVMIVGGVLQRAAAQLRARLLAFAAERAGLKAERLRLVGGQVLDPQDRVVASFAELADAYLAAGGEASWIAQHQPPPEIRFDEKTYQGTAYPAYGWCCDVVEVRVDPDTLAVRPERVTIAADVGRAIHPVLCAGQLEGGTLQALAWGYLEEIKLERGRYLNDRLQTYIIPTVLDTPDMETILIENPTPASPSGAKGVGELPMDCGAPAIVAAIENATGIAVHALPASPERLLEARRAGQVVQPQHAGA